MAKYRAAAPELPTLVAVPDASSSPSAGAPGASPIDHVAQSALPSRLARAVALSAIIVGGLCGGLIGFALADLQCTGDCTTWQGIGIIVGALVTAGGVAIVAVLTLRAMDEWETIKKRDAQ